MRTPQYYYFLTATDDAAYRVPISQNKKQKALGKFTMLKTPELFTPGGWSASNRYRPTAEGDGGVVGFTASIDTGVVRRVSMLKACAAVDGDVILFAPTLSSRLATSK